jgi:hypothetical protein
MLSKRMIVSVIAGAILGVVCIVGASIRSGFGYDAVFLFAFWYNRLLMGVVIGLLDVKIGMPKLLYRGAGIGLLVSFAFYSSIGFGDPVNFIAGIIYGVIIEYVAYKYGQ